MQNGLSPLLYLFEDFVKVRNRRDLFYVLHSRLKELFSFHHSGIGLVDKSTRTFSAFLLDTVVQPGLEPSFVGKLRSGMPYEEGMVDPILESQHARIFDLEELIHKNPTEYIRVNYLSGIREVAMVALRREDESFGFLVLFAKQKGSFHAEHVELLQTLSNPLSISLSNILINEAMQERESDHQLLLALSKNLTSTQNKNSFLTIVENTLRTLFHFDELTISKLNDDDPAGSTQCRTHSAYIYKLTEPSRSHPDFLARAKQKYPVADGIYDRLLESETALFYDMDELIEKGPVTPYITFFHENGMREMISVPLRENNRGFGGLFIYMRQKKTFSARQMTLLQGLVAQISIGVANIWAYEKIERQYEKIEKQLNEIDRYKSQLEEENLYLQTQIKTAASYTELVGSSASLKNVFELVSMVAASGSTVLISGETGTGKELVARAVHNGSAGKDKFMIKVNCAALPANLIESELFGHEKGSFTGATERRIGKFELADNSTLFLDEIGEMQPELQVKLLRAIQEKEIERIGGKAPIKVNVRIIAATNRNLRAEVEAGRFRSDLYYRLNVFPIHLPPLRERKEDIPLLASHFITLQCQKSGKKITNISHHVLHALMSYDWPGNIRELEHLIERSVLMTTGHTIREIRLPTHNAFPDHSSNPYLPTTADNRSNLTSVKTLDELERDHILSVLAVCNFKVGGSGGAAEMLQLPATTLHSRIKKLGIKKAGGKK